MTWVRFRVVNRETHQYGLTELHEMRELPHSGERFAIAFPDGSTRELTIQNFVWGVDGSVTVEVGMAVPRDDFVAVCEVNLLHLHDRDKNQETSDADVDSEH